MGCLNSIFKMWPDKNVVQWEKRTGGRGCEHPFEIKPHPTGFQKTLNIVISQQIFEQIDGFIFI